MKKLIALLFLIVSVNVGAWDSSSAYNTVAMSYTANSTITQVIVLNSTQQSQSSINFAVDVKNGGGRPTHDLNGNPLAYSTQTDTASVTIYRYNSAGQLLGSSVSQNYILKNYGSNAGWSAAPGDNLHPFTQASVSYSGSLADTAYIKVEMKGTDGAWWAGNYGAQWRTPTVTVGVDQSNLAYNSEFGIAPDGLKAQGWVANNGQGWSNCGVTSGSLLCVTNEAGVTANMWGGGYSATGGTTSGQAGGYSSTLTTYNATDAASGTITPGGGSTTPSAPAFDGTLTQTNNPTTDVITSGADSTAGFTGTQQARVNSWTGSTQSKNNILYIEQTYGTNNTVSITQSGQKNRIDFTMGGNNNIVNNTQTGSNYLKEEIPGWGNNITINQSNTSLTNYAETKIQGNGNTVNHTQTGPGNHILFNVVTGDINTVNSTQTGNAGHYLDVKLTGNHNSVISNQSGNTANKANIDLTNAGGAASVDLGQTGGKNFTIIQSCVNPAGCSTTVRQ